LSNITNDRNEKVAKVIEYDMVIRGAYLAHVIPIEELVKDIISYHFCSDEEKHRSMAKCFGKTSVRLLSPVKA
jgi:hypothetical protein